MNALGELLVAVLTGLGAMIGWGCADFFAKKELDRKTGEFAVVFWIQIVGLLPILILVLAQGQWPVLNFLTFVYLILFGIFDGVSDILLYRGFSKGKVSLLSPIFATSSGLVVLTSLLIFGEPIHQAALIGIGIIFVGVLLMSIDVSGIRRFLRRPDHHILGFSDVAAATVVYAIWLVLYDRLVSGQEWAAFLFIIRAIEAIALLAYSKMRNETIKVGKSKLSWLFISLIAIFDIAAYVFVSIGFSVTVYTSVIAVLSATFSLPTLLLARVFLKEKLERTQLAAIALVLTGIMVVVAK